VVGLTLGAGRGERGNGGGGGGRMAGRLALVTGASSGIGAATARLFVAEGARVALLARRAEVAEELAAELAPHATVVLADVSSAEQVADAVNTAAHWLGGLDVVVNAAGVSAPLDLAHLDPEAWRAVIDTNLSGTFYVARETGLRMAVTGGGTIVNIGSELSITGQAKMIAYCASKAGVLGLTRALAAELAPNVRVNAVCPGATETPMLAAEFELEADPAASRSEMVEQIPLRRFAQPDEIAAAILFLASEATFATGAALHLDGGTTMVLQ
jgi:NAD(P)-dependent dehydrogenase (short-subunit alcohol dehydrogenase family)